MYQNLLRRFSGKESKENAVTGRKPVGGRGTLSDLEGSKAEKSTYVIGRKSMCQCNEIITGDGVHGSG